VSFIFIDTMPSFSTDGFMRPHLEFPQYSRRDIISILSHATPPIEPEIRNHCRVTEWQAIWGRFLMAVCLVLSPGMDQNVDTVRDLAFKLWPQFLAPVEGMICASEQVSFATVFQKTKHILGSDSGLEDPINLPNPDSEGRKESPASQNVINSSALRFPSAVKVYTVRGISGVILLTTS